MVIRTITSVDDRVVITNYHWGGGDPASIVVDSSDALLTEFQVPLKLGYEAFTGDLVDAQLGHGQVLRHPLAIDAIKTALTAQSPAQEAGPGGLTSYGRVPGR